MIMALEKSKNSKISGFTIAEATFVISVISFVISLVYSISIKTIDTSMTAQLKSDFSYINSSLTIYNKQNIKPACHAHDMSNTNEKFWAQSIDRAWPTSPADTLYFISHTGDKDNPTANDFYYIGVVLDGKDAIIFDRIEDDGNLLTGKFRSQASPLFHYSYYLSYVTIGSHSHCE